MRLLPAALIALTVGLTSFSATRALAGDAAAAPAGVLPALAPVPASLRVDPQGTPLDATALKNLEKGEVLATLVEVPDNPVKKGVALGIVDAPPAKVLGQLTDFDHLKDFMPYVAKIVVDKKEEKTAEVSYWLEFPLGIGNRNYQLDLTEDVKTIDGQKVYVQEWKYTGKGNIKDTTGSWEIAPYGDGTKSLVRYTVFTDPGGSIPNWAKNMAAKSAMPKVVNRVQERVSSKDAAAAVPF